MNLCRTNYKGFEVQNFKEGSTPDYEHTINFSTFSYTEMSSNKFDNHKLNISRLNFTESSIDFVCLKIVP